MGINAHTSFTLFLLKGEMEGKEGRRVGGSGGLLPGKKKKKKKKIDIHSNHKSELSQRLRGGEIIIGLVLDYILHGADACAACKCV